jgi:prepilin-type processing-associated H-X9-DG protein
MRELLIRYLLGELDADERVALQAQLQANPELRQQLARLRECFAAHQDDELEANGPPRGLAERTAERVTQCEDTSTVLNSCHAAEFNAMGDPPAGILGWSLADLTVAGGVMIAVSMLLFPALRNSRDGTRSLDCQNNLRQIGLYGATYAQNHQGFFPKVGPNEYAGIFVARLITSGTASPQDLAAYLVCPASPLAEKIRSGAEPPKLASADAIQAMSGVRLAHFTATASPTYAYRFGYRVGHKYHYLHDERQSRSPLFSDAPMGGHNSMSHNHGQRIVQVAFADGSVRALTSCTLPGGDEIFYNDLGQVAAGISSHDSVLAPGDAALPDDQ